MAPESSKHLQVLRPRSLSQGVPLPSPLSRRWRPTCFSSHLFVGGEGGGLGEAPLRCPQVHTRCRLGADGTWRCWSHCWDPVAYTCCRWHTQDRPSEHCLWTTLPYCPIPNQELNEPELWGENCTGSHGACFQSSPPMSTLVVSSGVLRWD